MKDKNYRVNRDDIYVGLVVRTDIIRRYFDGTLNTGSYDICRSMIFVLDEKNRANDLLYNSGRYPVLNYTDEDVCMRLDANSILVKKVLNMSSILEHFGYGEELSYKDILEIKKRFLNGKFALDNCELFGYKEDDGKLSKILGNRTFFVHGNAVLSK